MFLLHNLYRLLAGSYTTPQRRLNESISYIKENFSGKIMVFSDSKTEMEDNKK